MFKSLFGKRPTTKVDVILGFAAAAMAVVNAISIRNQYIEEQEENEA